jgi:two-component system, OmpR family, KDP operon response regulator KdpE
MAALTHTLLVSAKEHALFQSLDHSQYQLRMVADAGTAMEAMRGTAFDLILVDDAVFASDLVSVLKELKRRSPLVPVLVFSAESDSAYQTDLMEAGADDLLSLDMQADEFRRRLKLILRQRRQAQSLAQRNQNLQWINVVARRMHSASDPLELIQDTIDRACATFKLYGIAISLIDGDAYRIYAGREGCSTNNNLYESVVFMKDYDPFRRVIQSGIVQIFEKIVSDPYYVPIPVLPSPESAIILPLNYQEHKLGAMAVFGASGHPLSHDDLLVYELFASQFTVALNNVQHYHSQRISAQSSQHLLRGWQRFITLRTDEEIADNLRLLVEDIPNVSQALVWMYNTNPDQPPLLTKTNNSEVATVFNQLEAQGYVDDLVKRLDERRMQPIIIQQNLVQREPLSPLYKGLRGQQLMVVPIMDSARFIGGIIASVNNSRQYSSDDSKLLAASLAHAAGQAMERITLIQDMMQKSARLETLLRSTSQGIFFLDSQGQITFCNPQFTEITGINPSEVLANTPEHLLERLSLASNSPSTVMSQLREAVQKLQSLNPDEHEDYPIVDISLVNPARDIQVEFMRIGDEKDSLMVSWAGLVRDNTRFKQNFGGQTILLDVLSERIRVPYAQVRGLITTLSDQHSRFTHRERSRFLRQLEDSVDQMGRLWDNLLEMYQLQASGLALSPEQVDLYEVVQRTIDSRPFAEYRRQFALEAPSNLPLIEIDELRIEQSLVNILQNAIRFSPNSSSIYIRLQNNGTHIQVTVQDQGSGIPSDELEEVFQPFFQASNNNSEEGAGLGLFLSREVIRQHGGDMWIQSTLGQGTVVGMALPVRADVQAVKVTPIKVPAEIPARRSTQEAAQVVAEERPVNGRRVSERPMQTIMIVQGRSKLTTRLQEMMEEEYEIITYDSGEDALRDLNTVRLDLIFLDVNLRDANGLDVCERLCKRTEVPVIMLADEQSEAEKVRALMIGADDYISSPISNEELIARVNVIFKRRRIPDRTREPLDLGSLYVDFARREVFLNDKPLELTRIEYDLLHTLAVHQGQVLTHKQLLEKVWGPEYQAETQYLWVNVSRLRKKLEPTADSPRYIHTQPGVGYVFRPN